MEIKFTDIFEQSRRQRKFMLIMDNIYKKHINVNVFRKFLREWENCEEHLINNGIRYNKDYPHNHPTTKEEDTTILNEYRTKVKELGDLFMYYREIEINKYQFKCERVFTSLKNNIMFVNGIDLFYNKVFTIL